MIIFNSLEWPNEFEKIDYLPIDSNYIVEVENVGSFQEVFYEYGINYFSAAEIISEYIFNNNMTYYELDSYIFPLTFLYRHSFELMLKAIVFKTITDKNCRIGFIKRNSHCLSQLLDYALSVSRTNCTAQEITWLKRYFESISKIDKESDSFRYPFSIIKNKTTDSSLYKMKVIFESAICVDLGILINQFETAFKLLDKWYCGNNYSVDIVKEIPTYFLAENDNQERNPIIEYHNNDCFYNYIHSYTDTACQICITMKHYYENGKKEYGKKLFFPMCYLFRNGIELYLKSIIVNFGFKNMSDNIKIINRKKHSIIGLWHKVNEIILKYNRNPINQDNAKKDIAIIETYCKQLHDFDYDADKFRYPASKNLNYYFKISKKFDFIETKKFFESIINFFDGITEYMSVEIEF